MKEYKEKCPECGGWVIGEPNRDFVREIIHDSPDIVINNVPGGGLVRKGLTELGTRLFKKDITQMGDQIEKLVYEDILLDFNCPNPECGHMWSQTYQLEKSEYKQLVTEWAEKAKDMLPQKDRFNSLTSILKKKRSVDYGKTK